MLPELKLLRTPERIQEFLDRMPINHEKRGETCSSPKTSLARGNAHCLEGAFIAAVALSYQGHPPLLMNLKVGPGDIDHAVALFKRDGLWGAISKTNHAVLRYRDPVYRTLRELALSYFHEYFLANGRKTLRAYSRPVNLNRFGTKWVVSDEDLWGIAYALADAPHLPIAPKKTLRKLRKATPLERRVMGYEEWKRQNPRT